MNSKSERFELRLEQGMLGRLDTWRVDHGDGCSRAEAVRQLVESGLQQSDKQQVQLSDGEKMIISMLCDLRQGLESKGGELDFGFIHSVLNGGHYWALARNFPGIFGCHPDDMQVVREVTDILEMWEILEWVHGKLSTAQKEKVASELSPRGETVRFLGFDGNNEVNHLSVAGVFVDDLKLFQTFKGRDLNSHIPVLDRYRRMLEVFKRLPSNLKYGGMSASHIIEILR